MEIFDRCSFLHIFSGALFGYVATVVVDGWWPLLVNGIIAVAWELLEMSSIYLRMWNTLKPEYRDVFSGQTTPYAGDSLLQMVSDVVLHMASTTAVVATDTESSDAALIVMGTIMGASAFLYAVCAVLDWLPVANRHTGCCVAATLQV